ncbi:hypothetical protein HX744_04005 [Pseudonocardia sp. ICBG1122]|nr:hypothetical protein [Pseudonocardia pini]
MSSSSSRRTSSPRRASRAAWRAAGDLTGRGVGPAAFPVGPLALGGGLGAGAGELVVDAAAQPRDLLLQLDAGVECGTQPRTLVADPAAHLLVLGLPLADERPCAFPFLDQLGPGPFELGGELVDLGQGLVALGAQVRQVRGLPHLRDPPGRERIGGEQRDRGRVELVDGCGQRIRGGRGLRRRGRPVHRRCGCGCVLRRGTAGRAGSLRRCGVPGGCPGSARGHGRVAGGSCRGGFGQLQLTGPVLRPPRHHGRPERRVLLQPGHQYLPAETGPLGGGEPGEAA